MMLKTELNRVVGAVLLLCVLTTVCHAVTPLARIKTRPGSPYAEFYNSQTGEVFKPIGSSYVKLYITPSGAPTHSNFIPGLYDANDAEEALSIMQQSGYTVVRVWCYHGNSTMRGLNPPFYSIEGPYSTNTPDLYQPYVDNLLDFIERANRHGIYVQLVIDRTPDNTYYQTKVNTG